MTLDNIGGHIHGDEVLDECLVAPSEAGEVVGYASALGCCIHDMRNLSLVSIYSLRPRCHLMSHIYMRTGKCNRSSARLFASSTRSSICRVPSCGNEVPTDELLLRRPLGSAVYIEDESLGG
jgi:hypothetical protein